MKTSSQIQFDFRNAMQQASRLDELASQLERRVVQKMGDAAQQLQAAWKGDSASLYLRKELELQRKIKQSCSNLRSMARDIRAIANQVHQTEQQALAIALKRNASR